MARAITIRDQRGVVGVRAQPAPTRAPPWAGVRLAPAAISAEWRWVALVTLATLVLIEIPYLLAYAQAARGMVFVSIWAPHDFGVYRAAMREGAASSSWLIHDHLTAEPHDPAFMFWPYVALGKLAGALGFDFQVAYHVAEIVARATLLVSIYLFCAAILTTLSRRRIAFVLITFSSGLSLLASALGVLPADAGATPAELNWPEVSTFVVLFTAPHLMLGLAFLLLAARFYSACWSAPGLRQPAAAGFAVFALGLTNSFSLPTVCAAVAAHLAALWLRARQRPPSAALLGAGAVFLAAAPFLAYSLFVFGSDPLWSVVFGPQIARLSPPLPSLALGLGAVLALALVGLPAFSWRPTPARLLVLVWIVVTLTLMYVPMNFQRRFAFGLHPMLAIIAAAGLEPLWRWVRRPIGFPFWIMRPALTFAVAQALFGSALILYLFSLREVSQPPGWIEGGVAGSLAQPSSAAPGTFQPMALKDAATWLATAMGPDDVILAQTDTANYLAGFVPGRVFIGHWASTVDFLAKDRAMRWFYSGRGDEDAISLLSANSIRYVVYGPYERALNPSWSPSGGYLQRVYANGDVSVYEVTE